MKRLILISVLLSIVGWILPPSVQGQAGGGRAGDHRRFGVNFTVALYQYDEVKSKAIDPEIRMAQTFETAEAEGGFLQRTYGLEDIKVRHMRSVGLITGEVFHDGAPIGDDRMSILITAQSVTSASARMDIKIAYGKNVLLDKTGLKLQNFETVALKGGRERFGLQVFQGPEGPEQTKAERTLLVTATAVVVPAGQLRNRPREISRPTDEFGREVEMNETDIFFPPIVVDRVVPRVPMRRPLPGTLLLEGTVTPEGKVINIRVLRTFDPEFNDMAMTAFRGYKFLPARLNGQPIYATFREDIAFQPAP
jgi:TonB family protein